MSRGAARSPRSLPRTDSAPIKGTTRPAPDRPEPSWALPVRTRTGFSCSYILVEMLLVKPEVLFELEMLVKPEVLVQLQMIVQLEMLARSQARSGETTPPRITLW